MISIVYETSLNIFDQKINKVFVDSIFFLISLYLGKLDQEADKVNKLKKELEILKKKEVDEAKVIVSLLIVCFNIIV